MEWTLNVLCERAVNSRQAWVRLYKVISQTVNRIRIEKVSPTLTEDKLVGKNIKKKVYHFDLKKVNMSL